MATEDASPVQVDLQITPGIDGPKVSMRCSDRTAVVPLSQLLSALRSLTNAVVDAALERERSAGREISCQAGCGACCRQLVPLSITEARQLPKLIEGLSDAHRGRVQARFNDAISRLRASSLWDRLERYATLSRDERLALGMEYFRLGIACPFLEDESCSIHPVRPLICRQYLVTSPADHCTNPSAETITRVPLSANVLGALIHIEAQEADPPQTAPLVLAPILKLGEGESKKPAPDWMGRLLAQIKTLRDEQIAAGKQDSAPDAD
jgi:Fe-S-cluster containining protein